MDNNFENKVDNDFLILGNIEKSRQKREKKTVNGNVKTRALISPKWIKRCIYAHVLTYRAILLLFVEEPTPKL